MAINKVEVQVLAVGQGSCNIVKGYDRTNLEYLAILDAGGDGCLAAAAMETLKDCLAERAAAMGTAAPSQYYADLLSISHSDGDHYNIIYKFAEKRTAVVNTRAAGGVTVASKVKAVGKKGTAPGLFGDGDDDDGEDGAFESFKRELWPFRECFVYRYRADVFLERDDVLVDTSFDFRKTFEITEWGGKLCRNGDECFAIGRNKYWRVWSGGDDGGVGSISVILPRRGEHVSGDRRWKNSFSIHLSPEEDGFYDSLLMIEYGSIVVDSDDEFKFGFDSDPKPRRRRSVPSDKFGIGTGLTPESALFDILRAVRDDPAVKREADWFVGEANAALDELCAIRCAVGETFSAPPRYGIDAGEIRTELGISAGGPDAAPVNAPTDNALRFGEVKTSLSLQEAAKVEFLKQFMHGAGTPALPPEIHLKTWEAGFSMGHYKKDFEQNGGTVKDAFDRHFRNINSLITVVGFAADGPKYVFPGDATVQSLWYNTVNHPDLLPPGSDGNILAAPHHGAYRTTSGSANFGSVQKVVFPEFLAKIDPACILVSAGYESHYGHPNVWVLNECAKFLNGGPPVAKHVLHYNTTNQRDDSSFVWCTYDRQLFTLMTLADESSSSVAGRTVTGMNHVLVFADQGRDFSIGTEAVPFRGDGGEEVTVPVAAIKTYDASGGFPVTLARPLSLPDHPVFQFHAAPQGGRGRAGDGD